MSMTHGSNGGKGSDEAPPPRPPSQQSSGNSSGGSKLKCIGRYVFSGDTLGKGNFARVESAFHTIIQAKVAIKIIEIDKIKEDYVRKNLLREAQLMRRLHHPNIIRLYETMKTSNLYCLVTEIADGGELLSYVRNDFKEKRLTEATTRPFIRQLVSALDHLHSTGIVHRDLKMENILLDKRKRNIKIVDFGLSNSTKPGSLLQTHCGSPEYAAPELFIPGREYGPEVDVWSLGVNLYAMLVGKLPFRSPRQGTKRRQKLLEQISAGISEYHEKEMAHVSIGAKDLINRLLQPDSRRRAQLHEVMQHPWVTKNGEHPLLPYAEPPIDSATKAYLINLMSCNLGVSSADVKDAVKRDRCDWLAAIFNLLIDQPEGRNHIQQANEDPEDQLVDAQHYQGTMEHFRLSQADSLDVSSGTKGQGRYRHSQALSQTHPQSKPESSEYVSSTLPLTKRERKHHQSQESRQLGPPRVLNPLQQPPGGFNRRASIANPYDTPDHDTPYQSSRDPILSHYYHQQPPPEKKRSNSRGRRLPSTPAEEPYHRSSREPSRSHSRAESMPDPLPLPWKSNIATITQLAARSPLPETTTTPPPKSSSPRDETRHHSRNESVSPLGQLKPPPKSSSPRDETRHHSRNESVSPLGHLKPSKKSLKPIRPKSHSMGSKSLSRSVDTNLHQRMHDVSHQHTRSVMWPPQAQQIGPLQKMSTNGRTGVGNGWHSPNSINSKKALPGKLGKDIQGLMEEKATTPRSAYSSIRDIPQELNQLEENGSIVSVDIQPELFKPLHYELHHDMSKHQHQQRPTHSYMNSGEALKVDSISGAEISHYRSHARQPHSRSTSAKIPAPGYQGKRLDMASPSGYVSAETMYHHHRSNGDIYHNDHEQALLKNSGRKSSTGGKTFKFKNSKQKSASTTLHPKHSD